MMTHTRKWLAAALAFTLVMGGVGCTSKQPVKAQRPDYSRELAPGESALRLITDPNRMPDLATAYRAKHVYLLNALDQSAGWFTKPSTRSYFPTIEGITHEQAHASVLAFRELIEKSPNEAAFVDEVKSKFDVYESVGYNGEGIVLFTGYYSPVFKGSRTKTAEYAFPLYKRPADLVTDPKTGQPMGQKQANGSVTPYPTRKQIEESHMLDGTELVWLPDALSVYIIQVNGSARLRMDDGSEMFVGYAGKTDRAYKGLGATMLDEGMLTEDELSLPNIRRKYRENPAAVQQLINRNESYVFFTEYGGDTWPAGSLGVKVSPEATLATDKKIYPRGGVVMVDTQKVNFSHGKVKFQSFMMDQDTGGAIRAPGRADIYMGVGDSAEILAGAQYSEGRLYYFILKDHYVQDYLPAGGK